MEARITTSCADFRGAPLTLFHPRSTKQKETHSMAMQGTPLTNPPVGTFMRAGEAFTLNGHYVRANTAVYVEDIDSGQPGYLRVGVVMNDRLIRGTVNGRSLRELDRWRLDEPTTGREIRSLKRHIRIAQNESFPAWTPGILAGDQLELAFPFFGDSANGSTIPGRPIPVGTAVTVVGLSTNKLRVRVPSYSVTIWVLYEDVRPPGSALDLGEIKTIDPKLPPEDLEDAILPSDPRIAWLFERISEYAKTAGYCGQYDAITELFGIPGRKREFRVTFKLGPAEFAGKIEARSQAEADEQFKRETLAAFKEAMAE
jgi:hypothetical protein